MSEGFLFVCKYHDQSTLPKLHGIGFKFSMHDVDLVYLHDTLVIRIPVTMPNIPLIQKGFTKIVHQLIATKPTASDSVISRYSSPVIIDVVYLHDNQCHISSAA